MCQECGCTAPPDDMMPMLDMSHLWQDGQFYWAGEDGENKPVQELSDEDVERGVEFSHIVLRRYKETYDEAMDIMEFFPDNHRAALLNGMDWTAQILFALLNEAHRREELAHAW